MPKYSQTAAAVALSLLAGSALAQDGALGTPDAKVPSAALQASARAQVTAAATAIRPFTNAQYGTGGVALRNRQVGVIHVSGVTPPVQAAYLYWAFLFASTPPATQTIGLRRLNPNPIGVKTLTGTLIATGGDPCWGSSGIAVYRARIPAGVATGNGAYEVLLNGSQSALNTGEDPWDGNVQFPAAEGASIAMVGTGASTVVIYDTQIPSGTTFFNTFNYTLNLPHAASGGQVLWDTFGADGQTGTSRNANPSTSGETTKINGVAVSGTGIGASDPDSDWNGNSGAPLPQLWDDTGHDITAAVPSGTTTLAISISAPLDCVSTVGNVVSFQ